MATRRTARAVPGAEAAELPAGLKQRLGLLLLKSHRAVKRLAEAELAPLGLSTAHLGILEMLRASPGLSQATLGAALEIDRTSMGSTIGELERLKVVERIEHPDDGRSYALRLTPSGRALADRASGLALAAQDRFLTPLDEKERRLLLALLQRALER